MAAVIHEKLYVTVQYRSDAGGSDGLLGFAGPYTKDSAFAKRKGTQDTWAYGRGAKVEIDEEDTITVTGDGGSRGGLGGGQKWDMTMLFIANCHPRIVDNTPATGFEIAKSVRRSGWNGSGNVKWRITDPRGFDLEISSENFAKVIDCCTMVNGVIQEECVWGREGKDNILLPVTSEPYQEAAKQTRRVNQKVSLKDLQIGDWIDLVNPAHTPEGVAGLQYLGKYYIYSPKEAELDNGQGYGRFYNSGQFDLLGREAERYFFRDEKGKVQVVGSPKVSSIINKIITPLNKSDVETELNALISSGESISNAPHSNPVLITAKRLKDGEATFEKVPFDISAVKVNEGWPTTKDTYYRYAKFLVCKYEDEWHAAGNTRTQVGNQYNNYTYEAVLVTMPSEPVSRRIVLNMLTTNGGSNYWNRYTSRTHVVKKDIDLSKVEAYTYNVRYGDQSYPINSIGMYVQ